MRYTSILFLLALVPTTLKADDLKAHPKYKEWMISLQDGPDEERLKVINILKGYGHDAAPATAALIAALKNTTEPRVAESIIIQLGYIGREAKAAVPEVLNQFRTKNANCFVVLGALARLGDENHRDVVRACLSNRESRRFCDDNGSNDPMPWVLQGTPEVILPELLPLIQKGDRTDRLQRMRYLANAAANEERIRLKDGIPHPWLCDALREQLAEVLGPLLQSENFVEVLYSGIVLAHAYPEYCAAATATILKGLRRVLRDNLVESRALPILLVGLPRLFDELLSPHEPTRALAEKTLRGMSIDAPRFLGPQAPQAEAAVRKGLKHANPKVRIALVQLLAKPGQHLPRYLPALKRLLNDHDQRVRFTAARMLGVSAPNTPDLGPVLEEMATTGTPSERVEAVRLLGTLGAHAHTSLPLLLRLTKHPHIELQRAAVCAVARQDFANTGAYLPHFTTILRDPQANERSDVLRILKTNGPIGSPILPTLYELLDQRERRPGERHLIADALLAIDPKHAADIRDRLATTPK